MNPVLNNIYWELHNGPKISNSRHLSAEIWPVESKGLRIDMTDNSYHTVVGRRLFGYDIMPAYGAQV